MLKHNYKRNRNFISELQGTAWNWGGWRELIGAGGERRGRKRRCGKRRHLSLWPGLGRKTRTSTQGRQGEDDALFRAEIHGPRGVWGFRLLSGRPPHVLQRLVPQLPATSRPAHAPRVSVHRTPMGCGKCHFWGIWTTGGRGPGCAIYCQCDHGGTSDH